MARLRVEQGNPEQAPPYLNLAHSVDPSAILAPDDTPWEKESLRSIQQRLAIIPESVQPASIDPVYPLVATAVAPLLKKKRKKD
jgi:hypothetical protein